MYIVTWITATNGVKREHYGTLVQATKRLKFLQAHHCAATLERI